LAHAATYRLAGDPAAALQALQGLLADTNPEPRLQRVRLRARVEAGLAQLAQGHAAAAATQLQAALDGLARLQSERTPLQAEAGQALARAVAARGP
jgi:hypothetical protein